MTPLDRQEPGSEGVPPATGFPWLLPPLVWSVGLTAVIWVVDLVSGYRLGFSLFYLVPVSVGAWFGRRWEGIAASILATTAWVTADTVARPDAIEPLITLWNTAVRFGFFIVTALILARLKSAMQHEALLARRDPLTGLLNTRALLDTLTGDLARCRRQRLPLTVAYADCDKFKQINDTLGHQVGDELLSVLADVLRGSVRASDVLARVGGDELVIILPGAGREEATGIIERLIEEVDAAMAVYGWDVTLSIGVVTFPVPPMTPELVLRHADRLMYEQKHLGGGGARYSTVELFSGQAAPGPRARGTAR